MKNYGLSLGLYQPEAIQKLQFGVPEDFERDSRGPVFFRREFLWKNLDNHGFQRDNRQKVRISPLFP